MLNIIGHKLDDDPAPILYIGPTQKNVEKVIEPRILAMINSAEDLSKKLAGGKQSSKTLKWVNGVALMLGWAGSATEAASMNACKVIIDERDRMGGDIGGEGDIKELSDARHTTYADGSTTVISTPTTGNAETEMHPDTGMVHWKVAQPEDIGSATWQHWQEGTRQEWAWPCPHCKEYFIPRFVLLRWPKGASPRIATKEAYMQCPHCLKEIYNASKAVMNAKGVYIAPGQSVKKNGTVVGDLPENDTASFWVSGLCSPWRTWGQRASSFIRAVASGKPTRIQAVLNTQMAELYTIKGDAPPWQELIKLKDGRKADALPNEALIVTASVDVQGDRLYYSIRAWGLHMESWLIRHGELFGTTSEQDVWEQLAAFRELRFNGLPIVRLMIDSGWKPGDKHTKSTNIIYQFCRRFRGWAMPTKGHETQSKPLSPSMIDVSIGGQTIKKGLQLWHLDSDFFKSWVHTRLVWPAEAEGKYHLHADTTEDYMRQLVAEARAMKASGGITWIRTGENHYLDCEAGNVAAAYMLQVHTWQQAPGGLPGRASTKKPGRRRRGGIKK